MFTGIVESVGRVESLDRSGSGARLVVDAGALDLSDAVPGESIAVSGVCLTVTGFEMSGFAADVSGETLNATTLDELLPGATVNLERALRVGDRLGGHLVTGHVDGVGNVLGMAPAGDSRRLTLRLPGELAQYVARKGSLTVDGVSLTVNAVDGPQCEINLVPHTLSVTTLGRLETGRRVNLEVDLIARYLERQLQYRG
jgi:riboflavin synthase